MSEWKLAPIEPTIEMVRNVFKECGGFGVGSCGEAKPIDGDDVRNIYSAMLAAQPKPAPVLLTHAEISAIHDQYYRRMGPQEFAKEIEAAALKKNGLL